LRAADLKPTIDFAYSHTNMNMPLTPLPIDEVVPTLKTALVSSLRVVLSAPPGAGKTTRVPLTLLDVAWLKGRRILMLEPRRLAARRAATYMAQLLGERVGKTVGYRIRGDAIVGDQTRVEVVTEGIVTRMLHAAPELPGVGLVIFDEFHERSIHADLGLAFTLDVQKHLRDDLRVLVMSATLDGVAVAHLLGEAPIVESAGKAFPVETRYARFVSDKPLETRVADVISRALASEEGDILVFLPGMREIRKVDEKLQARPPEDTVVYMLHGDLPPRVQEAALAPVPRGKRKVILSTSIAETSLTIDGVRIVIDSGLVRAARFDARRGMSGLVTLPVSRAVADQRRGRAGRQGPGVCYRLWTEHEHKQLPAYPVPEIRTSDLAHAALDLALWGAPGGEGLAFLDPPPAAHLTQAQTVLRDLGAMTKDEKLTRHGRSMAELPIHPRLAHMIIKGKTLGCGEAACELAALLEEQDFLGGGAARDADLLSRVEEFRQGRGITAGVRDRVISQIQRLKEIMKIGRSRSTAPETGALVALAYPERVARKRRERPGLYQLAGGTTAALLAGSTLSRHEFLAVADVDVGSGEAKIYLAAPLNGADIETTFASEIITERKVEWNTKESKVTARNVRRLGAVTLSEQAIEPDEEEALKLIVEGVRQAGLGCLPWNKDADRFRARVQWAKKSLPELSELPDLSNESLMETLTLWLAPFIQGMQKLGQLGRLNLTEILRSQLSPRQLRELDRLVPPSIVVPSGSRVTLDYNIADYPSLSVKLQELFGLTETPRIGGGKIPITIYLLSPAARPLAVTQDLHSFWQNAYPKIRSQLRARYPKHLWPDDPLTATPTRKTIRKW
jgi:ATP-dependent helicase HrpB